MPEVRQSSFALLGDLTKACFQHVQPHVGVLHLQYFSLIKTVHVAANLVYNIFRKNLDIFSLLKTYCTIIPKIPQ